VGSCGEVSGSEQIGTVTGSQGEPGREAGGQADLDATAHLNAMNAMKGLPWPLTFSYSRALQNPALKAWSGKAANVAAAQKAFHHRAHMNGLAAQGKWKPEQERQAA
jgi:fructose-bisphosphate aldolase class I